MNDENGELNGLLQKGTIVFADVKRARRARVPQGDDCDPSAANPPPIGGYVQWASGDGTQFFPAAHTCAGLTPGVYEIQASQAGLFFARLNVSTDGLVRFPQTNCERVVTEIQTFWEREDRFRDFRLSYKRGIMLWGPPGSGKSCTIKLINQDVVSRGGIVVKFTNPSLFMLGMRIFRAVQPDTPVVVLMEDIDSILECFNESEVLNILDGVDQIEKAVFLATTNYPERLGARIINRPSRFDKRFKIAHPNAESRRIYFEHIIAGSASGATAETLGVDLARWVRDTDGFSLAHLKELFVAVTILGDPYEEAIATLGTMREFAPSSADDDGRRKMGLLRGPADYNFAEEN